MTGAREESELTGKGEEARMKAHQIAFVFGHGRGQVVVNQVARNATQRLKCMNMTAHECFEALAVRELDVHHAARSEEHTSELQSPVHLVCRLLLEKKNPSHRKAT